MESSNQMERLLSKSTLFFSNLHMAQKILSSTIEKRNVRKFKYQKPSLNSFSIMSDLPVSIIMLPSDFIPPTQPPLSVLLPTITYPPTPSPQANSSSQIDYNQTAT